MRTKTIFPTSEIPHLWASQKQAEAKNQARNLYFVGKDIFSYGRHFCIARLLDNGQVLFTNRTYSKTTAKHIAHVRYAVNHKELIYVANPDGNFVDNLIAFSDDLSGQFDILNYARKRPATKEQAKVTIDAIVRNTRAYLEAVGKTEEKVLKLFSSSSREDQLEFVANWKAAQTLDFTGLAEAKIKIERKLESNRKREAKKREKEMAQDIELWKQGLYISIGHAPKVYLRVEDDHVRTSKGARVKLEAAKVLFNLIQSGRDIKGHDIDGYTVISINGVLKIGCHEIERDEINRFAVSQNWGTI